MSTQVPPQIGASGLVVLGAPRFPNYIVQAGTWTVKDALKVTITRDGNSNVFNYTGYSPGEDDGCTWTIVKGNLAAKAMDLVTESLPVRFTGQPTAGQTIIVGAQTYTFEAALTGANQVLIGATLAATIQNFINAVLATAGDLGTTVGTGTAANLAATASLDPQLLNCVLLAQITPWTTANPLQVAGTCTTAFVNNLAVTAGPIVARTFVVQADPETDKFGGVPVEQKVKLAYHADGFVPVAVAS